MVNIKLLSFEENGDNFLSIESDSSLIDFFEANNQLSLQIQNQEVIQIEFVEKVDNKITYKLI